MALALFDHLGVATDTVTSPAPGTLTVSIRGGAANVLVSGETDIGTILPESEKALTKLSVSLALLDPEGNETYTVTSSAPGTLRATVDGAGKDVLVSTSTTIGTVTSTAMTSAGLVTGGLNFQVGDSGLRLGSFDSGGTFVGNQMLIEPASTLSAAGNAQLSVVVLTAAGDRVTTAEDVTFTSGFIAAGLATINPSIAQSVSGQASTLYSATGCSGADNVTASLVGADAQVIGTINIAGPTTNSVNFISAEPLLIVLRGTGGQGRRETSTVIFEVADSSGSPLPGVTVPTVVRVLASVDIGGGNLVTTVSDLMTVTTGLPDQDSISLAVGDCGDGESFAVDGGMDIFLLCRKLTVAMADKFNNPVVDGTAAVFTTEYGSIAGSCTTTNGVCSVEWHSQESRFPTLTGLTYVAFNNNPSNPECPSFPGPDPLPCP